MAGRPERLLDPKGGPFVGLALDLRELRQKAGNPSYREMARRVHRSQTALSEAAGGAQLPTWDTLEAYVRACGGDPTEWRLRWEALRASGAGVPQALSPTLDEQSAVQAQLEGISDLGPTLGRQGASRRRPVVLMASVIGLVAVAALLHPWNGSPKGTTSPKAAVPAPSPSSAFSSIQVRDGADPENSGCSRDPAVTILDTTEVDYAGLPAGVAQIKYSPACGVAWPRFEPFSRAKIPTGAAIHVDIVRPGDNDQRSAFDSPYAGAPVFGNVLLSTSKCVYAVVWIDEKGKKVPEVHTHCFRGSTYVQ